MSIAGIQSNRGDTYQTLVAFDWALLVISSDEYEWIEIDSITYPVDDVVIGLANGNIICCQCKKNEPNNKNWTVASLGGELKKAAELLSNHSNAFVRFYSRTAFGDLASLGEYASSYSSEEEFIDNIPQKHAVTREHIAGILDDVYGGLSVFQFIKRVEFICTDSQDSMEQKLKERLKFLVVNATSAFQGLWRKLDVLGGRTGNAPAEAPEYRLSKQNLVQTLRDAGAPLAPVIDIQKVKASFRDTSCIGRDWARKISGHVLPTSTVPDILSAIDDGARSILITGLPGAGKTCVALSIQEALEARSNSACDIESIFIQAREFADFSTSQERESQGLSAQWVEEAGRLADEIRLVVIIDSLDVLSIAREHKALTYFIAQIQRLLLLPNITVITTCRDFDRRYDRRIAEMEWGYEFRIPALSWDVDIAPLLGKLGIPTASIDDVTRSLLKNPRELALYVELAQSAGNFSVVTSQDLAQKFIDMVIIKDSAIGPSGLQAVETIANEMLLSRSLSVPKQRFMAGNESLRALCSHNVFQYTHSGDLTLGHQTLFDVFVISSALRQGITLNDFISRLPQVPFVRPSIRSFVMHLASGRKSTLRRQIRSVLVGDSAFHIRRLVVETFSGLHPEDEDWPLVRDLRNNYKDMFQAIYTHASSPEWHFFFLKHLVPILIEKHDADGLMTHVHMVSKWLNIDPRGVVNFWATALTLDCLKNRNLAIQIGHHIDSMAPENLHIVSPILNDLILCNDESYNGVGAVIARCLEVGVVDDQILWAYIVARLKESDILEYRLGDKLRCGPYEFGDKEGSFLIQRMQESESLLNNAIAAIESWSAAVASRYMESDSEYYNHFLDDTSYGAAHRQGDSMHGDSIKNLMTAVEDSIKAHASRHSGWWEANRNGLAVSKELALRYFCVSACTNNPENNVLVAQSMLRNSSLLGSSLTFEMGSLIKSVFNHLSSDEQDFLIESVLKLWQEDEYDDRYRGRILRQRAELLTTIPCHMRPHNAQSIIDSLRSRDGDLTREPRIMSRGGVVAAPFPFDVFIQSSDSHVIQLLHHYDGHQSDFEDFLVGGEDQVAWQLREAASRQPMRFISLLGRQWRNIPKAFRSSIMEGASSYIKYTDGNWSYNNEPKVYEDVDTLVLAGLLIDELDRHSFVWRNTQPGADVIQACSYVVKNTDLAKRLVYHAWSFIYTHDERGDETLENDTHDLISKAINMPAGKVSEALLTLSSGLDRAGEEQPELLIPALHYFSSFGSRPIQALMLHRLPKVQAKRPEFGWDLFERIMSAEDPLWSSAEQCLYHSYNTNFDRVNRLLDRIKAGGKPEDLGTWGRIMALSALSRHIDASDLLAQFSSLDSDKAWEGGATVWSHPSNLIAHRNICLLGIEAGLNSKHAIVVAQCVTNIFLHRSPIILLPSEITKTFFMRLMKETPSKRISVHSFGEWLSAASEEDTDTALDATEAYMRYMSHSGEHGLYDHKGSLSQLLTRLFAEAEEREESDGGQFLRRVIAIQDKFLGLGVTGISDWLREAERQG
ncbi:MAG: ATP-binding protein [Gammaproteobacteria bacterium]|nr:ATP-binding protein [Gammaproteobacteria bacterium]MBQ0774729.1 ATP-binding protein [Gammaproteobacteria bacterium]